MNEDKKDVSELLNYAKERLELLKKLGSNEVLLAIAVRNNFNSVEELGNYLLTDKELTDVFGEIVDLEKDILME